MELLFRSVIIVLATLSHASPSMFDSQPQFAIKAEKNKAADKSCLFATFNTKSGNIADCLGRCLGYCRCQSFQICQNTKCQLCSSHKEENSSLLHDKDGCIYATYEMRHQVITEDYILLKTYIFLKCMWCIPLFRTTRSNVPPICSETFCFKSNC